MSLNDFVVLQKLGAGSFATVYKARRLVDQQIYAIKKIDLKALGQREKNNALNEIRLLACLKSQYIIGYCESFFDEKLDVLCIAMEYADGGDLFRKIENYKKQHALVPEVQVWKILIHLLYGLNQLHSKNILHRDLKSQNVFIANQTYKIGDMNVSKIVKNGRLAQTQTGTPYYASPQVWNDRPYNDKSDIWSLGCILYQLTALKAPFEAKTMQKVFDLVNNAPTPRIPQTYSRELQLVIDQCLQKNPLQRPSTKDLLLYQTVKIYENMLIQFKPSAQQQNQLLLKTIYMPVVKRQLKNKLPQSNYKNDRSKECKENEIQGQKSKELRQIKSIQNQNIRNKQHEMMKNLSINETTEKEQVSTGLKPVLKNIQNFIHVNDSKSKSKNKSKDKVNRNHSSSRQRNRIQSCQILKSKQNCQTSSKKDISSISSLIARAEMIAQSQNIQKNKPFNNVCAINKKKSSKEQTTNLSRQIKAPQKQTQKIISKNQYLRQQVEQIKITPKRLVFDDPAQQIKKSQNLKVPTQQNKTNQTPKQDHSDNRQDEKNVIPKEENIQDISKGPYLLNTMKNVSGISERNHSYYNFRLKMEEKQCQQKRQLENTSQKQVMQSVQSKLSKQTEIVKVEAEPIQPQQSINIFIDMNQNHRKIIQSQKQLSQQQKIYMIIGAEKIKSLWVNSTFKNSIFAMNNIKNEARINQLKIKEQYSLLKLHQQGHKVIKEVLTQQKVQKIDDELLTSLKPLEVKRNRSKSIPKTERPKHSAIANRQVNDVLIDKIKIKQPSIHNECTKGQLNQKLFNNRKQKQEVKVEKPPKRIFHENSNPQVSVEKNQQKVNQKIKQPAPCVEFNQKYLAYQKKTTPQYQNHTEQKPKSHALMDFDLNSKLKQNQRSQKKIFPNSIFSERNEFQSKKKRIFQNIPNNNNLVHDLNDKLDRINLQKKMKKYINV